MLRQSTMFSKLPLSGNQGLRVCVASDHEQKFALYNGLAYEAVAALTTLGDGANVPLGSDRDGPLWNKASLLKRALTRVPLSSSRPVQLNEDYDLFFYVGMTPRNLIALQSIKNWRSRCSRAAAFLFESWTSRIKDYRPYLKLLDDFDHVFIFNKASIPAMQEATKPKCSYLPAAVDCLAATPYPHPGPRPIDVLGIGRTVDEVHRQLIEMTAARELLYIWDHSSGRVSNYPQARFKTYHQIRSSRLFTSFNFRTPSASAQFKLAEASGEDAIPARVFEGAAAGAVLIGSAPEVPEFRELFDWPDAFIEIPTDPVDMRGFYSDLAKDPERIRRAGITNAAQSLRRHDWTYRWVEVLTTLELPIPDQVYERQERLAELAAIAESTL